MTPASAQLLAPYNPWMNQRMYEAAKTLPPAEVDKDRSAFFSSLFQTLNHIAVGDTIWLHRFAEHPAFTQLKAALGPFPAPGSLRQELATSLDALYAYRQGLDEVIIQWAGVDVGVTDLLAVIPSEA